MKYLACLLLLSSCAQISQEDCINLLVDCCMTCDDDDEACQETCMPGYQTCTEGINQ